jgi:glycosyltransferase involved in cell wall biosynthesis
MVLLDATPLRGPDNDRADAAYVSGLLDVFRERRPGSRPELIVGADRGPDGFVTRRIVPAQRPIGRIASLAGRPGATPAADVDGVVHFTSDVDLWVPAQVSVCHDLISLRYPSLAFGAGADAARRRFNRFLDRLAWARLVFVPTTTVARDVEELLGIPEVRVRVVGFGAPGAIGSGDRRDGARSVLVVANREPFTNAGLAIDALARTDPVHDLRLVIAGVHDARRRRRLEHRAAQRGVAFRTVVLGALDRGQVGVLRAQAAVAVIPSIADGASVSALAALSAALPIVGRDLPDLRETLGSAWLPVRGDDPDEWAAALDAVADDRSLRDGLARAARARAAECTWERAASEIEAAWAEVGDG